MPDYVTIYADDTFSGASQQLAVADYDHDIMTIGSDTLSSLKVALGYTATLYMDYGFSGDSRLIVADTRMSELGGFNDQVSSIRVKAQVPATFPYCGTCYLQTGSGLVFSAPGGGGQALRADHSWIGAYETFMMVPRGPGRVALMSANTQYVCAQGGGGQDLIANRDDCAAWETFNLIDHGNGYISLQASNGMYVCAEGNGGRAINATRSAIGPWETFRVLPIMDITNHAGETPVVIKPRQLSNGTGGYEMHLRREDDGSPNLEVVLHGFNSHHWWYVKFITGDVSNGGFCTITHAATGQLLRAPNGLGLCTLTPTFDRNSLWSLATNIVTNPGDARYGYRALRPARDLGLNLSFPDVSGVQVKPSSSGGINELWIW